MFLVDGTSLLYRAAHVYTLTTSRGEPNGVVYGAVKILLGLVRKLDAEISELAVFWDAGRSRYRTARYPNYKNTAARAASRSVLPDGSFKDQRAAVHAIFRAKGIRQVSANGVEADDLISIATTTAPGNHTVVSDDHDLWQLIGYNGTSVYAPLKEKWLRGRDDCYRMTGLWPEQIAAQKALSGDPSDNIPGVHGLGEKTAQALLAVVPDLPALYAKVRSGERLPLPERLRAALLAEEEAVKLYFDLCQPLTWQMLSAEEQSAFLAGWQDPVEPDRQEEIGLYARWEIQDPRIVSKTLNRAELGARVADLPAGTPPAPAEPVRRGMPATITWYGRLAKLSEKIKACQACSMRTECSQPVPGNIEDMSKPPSIMIVGRNPGATEDRVGRGFVGAAGKRLDHLLAGLDGQGNKVHDPILDRARALVTNTAHCYSIGNRAPTEEEWQTCASLYLREEIRILQPKLLLAFGVEAMRALAGHTDSIMQRAGTVTTGKESTGAVQYARLDGGERRWSPILPESSTVIVLPHPAAALRASQFEYKLQQSGRAVAAWLTENG